MTSGQNAPGWQGFETAHSIRITKTKIVAINGSPRSGWNTDMLVDEAAKGAESKGAEVIKFDLYKLEKFSGCISCFGCKRESLKGNAYARMDSNPFWTR